MKQKKIKIISMMLSLLLLSAFTLAGCGQKETSEPAGENTEDTAERAGAFGNTEGSDLVQSETDASEEEADTTEVSELEVRFGDDGEPFILHLYENDTAAAIAHHVGTASWRLPIYHYDDYENWESMQYYDIPDRYEIPSDAETITDAKSGEVYYSEPNRIILFYHDAEISAEYTKVGYFDATDAFVEAVEENPVLEGWGNKIVNISTADSI